MVRVIPGESENHIESFRELFQEYAFSQDFCLQEFKQELAGLPGAYAPPEGRLLAAEVNGRIIGCVGLRKVEPGVCEMKRLYVKPEFRGRGIGRALAEAVIGEAREAGYQKMRLDTIDTMTDAISLYRSIGFQETEPDAFTSTKGVKYLELTITESD